MGKGQKKEGMMGSDNSLWGKFLSYYCSEEWLFLVQNYLKVITLKQNEFIFSEGDEVTGVFYINSGMVKVVTSVNKNEERILRLANKDSLVGHRGLFSKNYPISAIALSDTEVTFIPMKVFTILLKTNPEFSMFLVNFISAELKKTEEQMKNMAYGTVIKRIVFILCNLIDVFGYDYKEPFKLKYMLSRTDIANLAGTTYESVVRTIGSLEQKKIVRISGKSLIILRESALRAIL